MNNAATITRTANEMTPLTRGEQVWDRLDGRAYRFARYDRPAWTATSDVVLMNDAGRELPDFRHPSQVRRVAAAN